jgi:hypothetical protein
MRPNYNCKNETQLQHSQTWFLVLENNDDHNTLECAACGFVFNTNPYDEENQIYDPNTKTLTIHCPMCGQRGE